MYFVQQRCTEALQDFKKALDLRPAYFIAIAGQAISHHALGEIQHALALWRLLIGMARVTKMPTGWGRN